MSNNSFWCENCNVPLISDVCGKCGSISQKVITTGLKPVFEKEYEMYQEALNRYNRNLKLPNILFKTQYYLVANGERIIRLSQESGKLKVSSIQTEFENEENNKEKFNKNMKKANSKVLQNIENETLKFIKEVITHHLNRYQLISFSGGKDSATTAFLVSRVKNLPLLFANTGIEFPETVDYTKRFAKKYGLQLIEKKPLKDFMNLCKEFGPPSRIMRWCCSTQKATPINDFYRDNGRLILSFDGIRRCESKAREKYERIRDNTKMIKQISAYPILNWTDFNIWLYALYRNIELNPVYQLGYTRIGCWACPNNGSFDNILIKRTHPALYRKWTNFLFDYAKKNKKTKDWVLSGAWKMRRVAYHDIEICSIMGLCGEGKDFSFNLKKHVTSKKTVEFLKIFGQEKQLDEKFVEINSPEVKILAALGSNILIVKFIKTNHIAGLIRNIGKQLKKSFNCVECGACMGSCPFGAINVNGSFKIDEEKCKHCNVCCSTKYLGRSCVALHYKPERAMIKKYKI